MNAIGNGKRSGHPILITVTALSALSVVLVLAWTASAQKKITGLTLESTTPETLGDRLGTARPGAQRLAGQLGKVI